jgi:hypothetical protein
LIWAPHFWWVNRLNQPLRITPWFMKISWDHPWLKLPPFTTRLTI